MDEHDFSIAQRLRGVPLTRSEACSPDLDQGRTLLKQRLGFDPLADSHNAVAVGRAGVSSRAPRFFQWQRGGYAPQIRRVGKIALAACAVLGIGLFARSSFIPLSSTAETSNADAGSRTYATRAAQRADVVLDDGTRVVLSPNSTLTVVSRTRHASIVMLDGRAFFDVAHAKNAPFTIHTRSSIVRVLGTAFSVDGGMPGRDVKVTVASGKVSLQDSRQEGQPVVITPGSAGVVRQNGDLVVTQNVDVNRELSWITDRLVFVNTPVPEVLAELERWYGIQFDPAPGIESKISASAPYMTATFLTDEPVDNVVRSIALMLGVQADVRGSSIILRSIS